MITMSDEYVREADRVSMTSISESEASYQIQESANPESQPNPVNYGMPERPTNSQERGDQPTRSCISSAILLRARRRNIRARKEHRQHDVLPVQDSWREPTPTRRQATEN